MSLDRMLTQREVKDVGEVVGPVVPLDDWLADLLAERDALIMRLRSLDRVLVQYGRIKQETIPKRVR